MHSGAIVYPIIHKDKWSYRYSLPARSRPCKKCGKTLVANIPFATGGWRGLTSEPHECGEEYDLFVATKADKEERKNLAETFHALSFQLIYSKADNPFVQ